MSRSHDFRVGAPVDLDVCGHSEIEDHDPSVTSDQNVRRLDVPMKLARGVERVNPFGELRERAPEARDVRGGQRSPSDGGGCNLPSGLSRVGDEVDAFDEFHRKKRRLPRRHEFVQ